MKSGMSAMSSTVPGRGEVGVRATVEEALAVVGSDDDQRPVVKVLFV
jgi:hypothetical protein